MPEIREYHSQAVLAFVPSGSTPKNAVKAWFLAWTFLIQIGPIPSAILFGSVKIRLHSEHRVPLDFIVLALFIYLVTTIFFFDEITQTLRASHI